MFDRPAIARDFGLAAVAYDVQARLQAEVRARCMALVRDYWNKGDHILDVGCGTGALAAEAIQEKLGCRFSGVDLAQGMCALAQAHMPVAVAAAESLPFADDTFDGAFSSLMLQWTSPLMALREMRRVVKPGGICVAATFCEGTLAELREVFSGLGDAPHVSEFVSAPGIAASAVHAGFRILSAQEDTITETYPDALALMRSIKSIGATNKVQGRPKGLMTPRQLSALAEDYQTRFSEPGGVAATWKVFTMVLEKA